MKRVIRILNFIAAWATSIMIIFTILTSYDFLYIGRIFESYLPIQIGLSLNMLLLSLDFFLKENGRRKLQYSIFSFILLVGVVYYIEIMR